LQTAGAQKKKQKEEGANKKKGPGKPYLVTRQGKPVRGGGKRKKVRVRPVVVGRETGRGRNPMAHPDNSIKVGKTKKVGNGKRINKRVLRGRNGEMRLTRSDYMNTTRNEGEKSEKQSSKQKTKDGGGGAPPGYLFYT